MLLYITLLLLHISLLQAFNFRGVYVNITDTRVRATTSYSLYLDRTTDTNSMATQWNQQIVSTLANVTITFPQEYASSANYTCLSLIVDDFIIRNYSCVKIGTQIIIRNFLTADQYIKTVQITVGNVKNPKVGGTTGNFLSTLGNDTGIPYFFSSVTLTANSFDSCSVSFPNSYGNSSSNLVVQTTSVNSIQNSDYLVVTFPYYWTRDAGTQQIAFQANKLCSLASGQMSSIQCSGSFGSNGYPKITINQLISGIATATKIFGVLSPPTNQPIDLVKIQSFDYLNRPIDICTTYPSGLIERTITNINVTPLQTPYPSTSIGLTLIFQLPQTLVSTDTIYLSLSSSYTPSFSFVNLTGTYPVTIYEASGAIVNFTFNRTQSVSQVITITIYSIQTPSSIAPVLPFQIGIEQFGYLKMKGNFGFNTQVGLITAIGLSVDDPRAGLNSVYRLNFTVAGTLSRNGAVRVYFPDVLVIPLNMKVYCQGVQLTWTKLPDTNCLQLTNFQILPSNPIRLTFANITNPSTTTPLILPISIISYLTTTLMDEMGQGSANIILTLNARPTLLCQITSSSVVTAEPDVNFTIVINNTLPILFNSYVRVFYQAINGCQNVDKLVCRVNGRVEACWDAGAASIGVSLNNTQVASRLGFSIVIGDCFTNPPNTKPVALFQAKTYTPQGYLLQYMTMPVYLTTITQARQLSYFVLLSRTSTANSARATYTFAFSQQQSLVNTGNNAAALTFPSYISIAQSSCGNCQISGSTIRFSISSSSFTITISNVLNRVSAEPTSDFQVQVMMDSQYLYSQSLQLHNTVANSQPSILNVASSTYSSALYGDTCSLVVKVSGILSATQSFVFTFPKEYDIRNAACAMLGGTISSCVASNASLTLSISAISTPNLTITLSNFILPNLNQSLPILIESFSATGYIVSSSSIAAWQPICSLPCRTCPLNNPNQCLSCFNNIQISFLNLHDPANNRCIDQCDQNQILIQMTCISCSNSCASCANITTNCTSCSAGFYLYDHRCLANCPDLYYRVIQGRYCEVCQTPCQTCVTQTQCLSCRAGYYFFNGICRISCPNSVTVPDSINNACLPCSPICLSCADTVDHCTSCNIGFAMQAGVCVSQCSNNMYILNSQCVQNCSYPCITCSVYATYCLTCPATLYLYSNKCVSQCAFAYYASSTRQCLPCSSLAINCINCQSPTVCLSCDSGFVFFEDQCINYIPSGYANISGVAQPCSNQCVTCLNLVNNCTTCRYDFYYNGLCIPTCPITHYSHNHQCTRCISPCNTCLNSTACLSCLGSTNKFWLSTSLSCENLCPQFYYANSSLSQCLACQPPCVSCTSLTSCISCIQGTYFYNSRCVTTCPPGYFPNITLNQCTICQSPCLTCSTLSPTVCLTCISTYFYLYPNACVPQCPPEYIVNYEYRVCVNCTLPCLVCSQTQCFKCQNTHILYLQKCALACPSTHYVDILSDLTKECKACPRQCQTCLNANFCTLCSIGYFWQSGSSSGVCVQTCPATRPILMPTGCQPCQDENCTQCYPNNECYQCTNVTILFDGFCLLECPIGYVYNSSIETCEVAPPPIINQTVIIEQPNLSVTITMPIHMICTIVGAGLTLFILITVFCSPNLMLWPLLTAVWAIAEVAAITIIIYSYHLYFVYLFTDKKVYGFVLTAAAAWFFLVNISVFFHSICRVLLPDPRYRRWRKSAKCSQIFLLSLVQTSTLFNFKFQHLLWSGFKGSPKLQSTSKLSYLSVSSALGLVNSIAIVIILIFLINDVNSLFFVWLDAVVVIVITAILSGLALKRSDKFFEEKLEDMILHRKHISNDQFPSNPMKGTNRQEQFCPTPQQKSFGQPSYFESSSEASSRYQLRSSSRIFVSSRSHSSQPELYQNDQMQIAEQQKKQISLQCSILSPNKSSSRSINSSASGSKKYYIQCDYQSGSKIGVMGSLEESKQWDGVVHKPVYFKQQYNLNNAVILDQDGNLVEGWDVESNEAVIEQSVDYSKKTSFHNQEQSHNQRILDDIEQVQTAEAIKNNFKKTDNYIQRQENESLINMESENNQSIDPITHRNNVQQNEERIQQCNDDLKKVKSEKQQKSVIQNYRELLKQRLAGPTTQIPNAQRQQNFSRLTNQSKNNEVKSVQNNNKLILFEDEMLIPNKTVMSIEQTIKKQDNFEKTPKQEKQEKQQKSEENQIIEDDNGQEETSQNDRFDNSVISGHQGSISDSQGDEYQGSQVSNHNGSLESDEDDEENEEEEQISENVSDEGQRKYTSVSIDKEKNLDRQQCENEIERWQFLLHTNDRQNNSEQKNKQDNKKESEEDQGQDDEIENDENKGDECNQDNENGMQLEQIKQFSQEHSQEMVNNNSKLVSQNQKRGKKKEGNSKDSRVSGKQKKQKKQQDNRKGSEKKEMKKKKQQVGQEVEDEEQINQIDDEEQEQYLHSKQTKRQSNHDDNNQFSIKTKVKKKGQPKHKVVVVDSKKFKKLKRQASELQKQVDRGQRLKTQMEEQPNQRVKSREPRERKSKEKKKSRDEQLKGIYMRSKRPQI